MTIVSVKVGSRKENWIARAEEHFYKLGIYTRDEAVGAREMAELTFDSFVQGWAVDVYDYSPESAVEEELTYWGD